MSNTEHGIEEDQPGVHPNILNEYYGTDQPRNKAEVNATIAEDQESDIRHEGANVLLESSPFTVAQEAVFLKALDETMRLNILLGGYGLAPTEWLQCEYPTQESVRVGSGHKTVNVELPADIWWPRAVHWVQGLDCMSRLLIELDYRE
jgi:hypothetical protein